MSIVDNVREPVRLYKHFFAAHPGRSTLMVLALTAAAPWRRGSASQRCCR